MLRLVSFCFLLIAAIAANAQNASTIVSHLEKVEDLNTDKTVSITAKLSRSSNLADSELADDAVTNALELIPSLRVSSKASIGATIAIKQNESTEEVKTLNTPIVLTRDPIKLSDDTSLLSAAQVVLPTDKVAREASLRAAAGLSAGVNHKFAILGKESSATYNLSALKNSHEFTSNNLRESNFSYRLRHIVGVQAKLNQKVSLSVDGYYQVGWTYDGVAREVFHASQSISYEIDKHFSISLDHANEGKMYEADNKDWNANIYDSRASEIGVTLVGTY